LLQLHHPDHLMADFVSLADFGAVNDGSDTVTTAWNAMLVAAKTNGKHISVPKGIYRFDSRPDTIDFCAHWLGAGQSNTGAMLIKNYSDSVYGRGMIDLVPGSDGTRFGGFFIKNEVAGGTIIAAKASATATMTNLLIEDLNLSTTDNVLPDHYIYFDGSLKTTGALGCRVNALRNIVLFGATYASALFKGCNGLWWHGGGVYAAGSTTQYAGSVVVSGTSDVTSNGIRIDVQTCNQLILSHCSDVRATFNSIGALLVNGSPISIVNDATVTRCRIEGVLQGAAQSSWIDSSVSP
jgi:hypothetical protein